MSTFRRISLVLGAGALAINTACYAYAPVVGADLKPAQTVRIMLTPAGTAALGGALLADANQVDGTVSSVASDGSVTLRPDWLRNAEGTTRAWVGMDAVSLPPSYLSSVELKKLDQRKTVRRSVTAAGIAIAVVAIGMKWIDNNRNPGGGGPGWGGPQTGDKLVIP